MDIKKELIKKRSSYINSSDKDSEILTLLQLIIKRINLGYSLKEVLNFESDTININEIIKHIIAKPSRNPNDNFILQTYLSQFEEFQQLFFSPYNQKSKEILHRITTLLVHEKLKKDSILFRYGDKGENFYIILNGSVHVLLPYQENYTLNAKDYINTLIKLYLIDEKEICRRTIQINRDVYPVNEMEIQKILSIFIKKRISNNTKREEYIYLNDYNKKNQKYENLLEKKEIEETLTLNLLGTLISKILKKTDYYLLYKSFCYEFDKLYNGKINYESKINISIPSINVNYDDIDQYLNSVKPVVFSSTEFDPEVKIFLYTIITTLEAGATFGELAFNNNYLKCTATIYVNSNEIDLGCLSKSSYEMYLKSQKIKLRFNSVRFFIAQYIFKDISISVFEKKFFNFFACENYNRGTFLYHKNEEVNKYYFILEGEVQMSCNMTLSELNKLIKDYGGNDNNKILQYDYNQIRKNQKFKIKIHSLKQNELFQIENYTFENKKCIKHIFDCEVVSSHLKVYIISKKFFDIISNEQKIKDNIKEYIEIKRNIILKRLALIYKQFSIPPLGLKELEILPMTPRIIKRSITFNVIRTYSNSSSKNKRVLSNENDKCINKRISSNENDKCINKKSSNRKKSPILNNIIKSVNGKNDEEKKLFNKAIYRKFRSKSGNYCISERLDKEILSNKIKSFHFIKNCASDRVLFSKSVRTKKIIFCKGKSMNRNVKIKKNLITELKIKYTNKNFIYNNRKEFCEMRNKEDEKFQRMFTQRDNFHSLFSMKEKKGEIDNKDNKGKFIDFLMLEKWREKEFTVKKKLKLKRNILIHPLFKKTNYKSTLLTVNTDKHL